MTMLAMKSPSKENRNLLPSQKSVIDAVESSLSIASVVSIVGRSGLGKTEIALRLKDRLQADYVCLDDYYVLLDMEPWSRWDERVYDLLESRLANCNTLIVDDYTFLDSMTSAPRSHIYMPMRMEKLRRIALEDGKTILLVGRTIDPNMEHWLPEFEGESVERRYEPDRGAMIVLNPDLEPEDYRALLDYKLGAAGAAIDEQVLYLHAPHLTIRQIAMVCDLLVGNAAPDTQAFVELLNNYVLRDNVRLSEVEALGFDSLPGSEHIVEALETHVVMPFEHPDEALRLGIKAKRGVMLFGPPGTGKTAIGRALAHRLEGRFFLIDGTISTEPAHGFMGRVRGIIMQAVRNAPSVLFIDDADTLFNIPHVAGIVRYLLSLLDGMESANAGKVCVMMTVMDAAKVPDSLTRSGRVELWLETAAPEERVREDILRRWAGVGLPLDSEFDFPRLARGTGGLVPADLRRVMEDARLLFARDEQRGEIGSDANAYVERAIADLHRMRSSMAQALEAARA